MAPIFNIAHRGFSGIAPENTLAAVKKAAELGVNFIEIDIHQTLDKKLVVIHDNTVDRTTNGKGKVNSYTLEELKRLDAGSWKSEIYKNERIPTLEEFIEAVNGRARLLIEVKDEFNEYEGIEEEAVKILKKYGADKYTILQSFDDHSLYKLQALNSGIELHKLLEYDISDLFEKIHSGVYKFVKAINIDFELLSRETVQKIHEEGFSAYTWTVNAEEDIRKVISYGVNGIISNYPDRVKKVLGEL